MTTSADYIPQIQTHLDAIAKSESDTLANATRCGLSLLSAKHALKQENAKAESTGTFGALWKQWLKSNFGVAISTADMYIQLYQHREVIAQKECKSISEAREHIPPQKSLDEESEAEEERARQVWGGNGPDRSE